MNVDPHIEILAAKVLAGEASPEDETTLAEWEQANPENRAHLADLKKIWAMGPRSLATYAPDFVRGWREFQNKKQAAPDPQKFPSSTSRPQSIPLLRKYGWQMAAAVLALLVISFLVWPGRPGNDQEMLTFKAEGNQEQITLADGSQVWLREGSSLMYPASFDPAGREVELKGEAYFEVTHNPDQPFSVLANGTRTRVLGTTFQLLAPNESPKIEVRLFSGKVEFSAQKTAEKTLLEPGQKAVLESGTGKMEKSDLSLEEASGMQWMQAEKVYQNEALLQVVEDLQSFYGIPVKWENPPGLDCTFQGSLALGNLHENLNDLQTAFSLTWNFENHLITLYGHPCP
ncbi:MAG: FecR domain-containing protein [Bacteroidia bacterium]|nr:FecR domain-containing protein [Bacteroidia bacterium]